MEKTNYLILIFIITIALLVISIFTYEFTYVYPVTDKLETHIDINKRGYNPLLKFVKIKGITTRVYKMRYGFYWGIKPKVFIYNDSLLKKKVFYIDSTGVVWIFGERSYEHDRIRRGDCYEKDFGELEFKKIWQCD